MADLERYITAQKAISRAAVESGLSSVSDPFGSTDPAHNQLIELLTSVGQELLYLNQWQYMVREETFTTVVPGDTGDYDLPTDFGYMIPQTGWERTNNVPLYGPLSAQDWQYLKGRDLVDSTIYASFRVSENQLKLYPQPPTDGLEIAYEYMSRNWLLKAGGGYRDSVQANDDTVLYQPILVVKALKRAFLAARGFDTTRADAEYEKALDAYIGNDESAPILNAGTNSRSFPYLHSRYNTPDKGFGA
jgi:hypothetical protein